MSGEMNQISRQIADNYENVNQVLNGLWGIYTSKYSQEDKISRYREFLSSFERNFKKQFMQSMEELKIYLQKSNPELYNTNQRDVENIIHYSKNCIANIGSGLQQMANELDSLQQKQESMKFIIDHFTLFYTNVMKLCDIFTNLQDELRLPYHTHKKWREKRDKL